MRCENAVQSQYLQDNIVKAPLTPRKTNGSSYFCVDLTPFMRMIRLHEIKRSLTARKVQFYAKRKFMNERLAYREPFPYSKTEGEYAAMKKQLTKKIICIAVIIAIGCVAFFVLAPWAENPANYPKTIETLDSIENKAIVMTGTSIALATAAALVPGDATTPIANKLADIAGYMIIVYIAIIIEKYLLALTGVVTFKILIPIALALIALSIALPAIGDRIQMIVTTCVIPIAVLFLFLWIVKAITGMKFKDLKTDEPNHTWSRLKL